MSDEYQYRIVQAIPTNGDVIHAVRVGSNPWMYSSKIGLYLAGRSLCGVRGRDAWGGGGMRAAVDPDGNLIMFDPENIAPPTTGWNGGTVNIVCPRCISKARTEAKRVTR